MIRPQILPIVAEVVEEMQREIRSCVQEGYIPEKVRSFAELHDYVEANMLGSETLEYYFPEPRGIQDTEEAREEWLNQTTEVLNPAQSAVSRWLAAGGHTKRRK